MLAGQLGDSDKLRRKVRKKGRMFVPLFQMSYSSSNYMISPKQTSSSKKGNYFSQAELLDSGFCHSVNNVFEIYYRHL